MPCASRKIYIILHVVRIPIFLFFRLFGNNFTQFFFLDLSCQPFFFALQLFADITVKHAAIATSSTKFFAIIYDVV